jgi:hypothetical protein
MRTAFVVAATTFVVTGGALLLAVPLVGQIAQREVLTTSDQQAIAEFEKSIGAYVQLRDKVTAPIKSVPRDASPQELEADQALIRRGVTSARAGARAGDIFLPAFQVYLRRRLVEVFSRPDGKLVRASILAENPLGTPVRINGAYPETIPLTTMPPQLLEALPRLPSDLEFRFVGDRLILFDSHAHLIIDYIDRALPGA